MITTLKKIFILALTFVLLASLALPCFAAARSGNITITLEDNEKNYINDIKVNICQIAEFNDAGYFPVKAFEDSGISIAGILNNPNETSAKTVADYIKKHNLDTLSATSESGKVSFHELNLGAWIIFAEEDSKYTFNPYFVFIPYDSGGKLYYEVSSIPKLEDNTPDEVSIYVIKKWDDENNASKKRPDSVTIELLKGEDVVSSIKLGEENGWAHTFRKLPKDNNYSVREKTVANYKANYSGDSVNGFVITNSYKAEKTEEKLPQTGQYWWPIILIAIAGACFVLLGIYEMGVKKNGKEK